MTLFIACFIIHLGGYHWLWYVTAVALWLLEANSER